MFDDSADAFLADFGRECIFGAVTFLGILDKPDEEIGLGSTSAQTRQYKLTYATAAVSLKRESVVLIGADEYEVRNAPNTIDDGLFSEAELTKK